MNKHTSWIIALMVTVAVCITGRVEAPAAPLENLGNVIVYPNPFMPGQGHTLITFENLTSSVRLRIYKINGELVYEKAADNTDGSITWDVTNDDNRKVASGLYIYFITGGAGEKISGKIVILR